MPARPSDAELAARINKWLTTDGPLMSAAQFAGLIGVMPEVLATMLAMGDIFSVVDDRGPNREPRFPAWLTYGQRILPGVAETLAILRGKGHSHCLSFIVFYCEERENLGGKRVLDMLREGDIEGAVKAAEGWK